MSEQCGVDYYPAWSSRGMRKVRCQHKAKYTVIDPPHWSAAHVCGVHARVAERYGGIVVVPRIYEEQAHG